MNLNKLTMVLVLIFILAGCFMSDVNGNERTPEYIRKKGNHLKNEPSLYLQQHAHNPIDWYPWGDEALQRAKDEDKPIFLSIGYSSCHWCHVMEHETFEQDDVASYMNTHFICIKVDREERPDLDAVYMEAVQMMTGRGGWPMSVFLTPGLKPFYGGTYFPKNAFLDLTARIEEVYRKKRDDLENQAQQVAEQIERASQASLGEGEGLNKDMIVRATERAKDSFDAQNAGFNQAQKFPTPVKWRFLLHEYRFNGDRDLGNMIQRSCEAMAQGGLYDHVAGGFHRYTVDERWTVPHFEKMLYDNGQLASLLLEAGVVFDRADFTATGLDVLDFLLQDMRSDDGGIYASYDADSGGEEGSYYVWSPAEIRAVVGQEDGPALADYLGVSAQGNFEHTGKSVLTRRANLEILAQEHGRTPEEFTSLFAEHRQALRESRDQRTPPGLDRKVVTSWNGLAITALAQGYAVTGDSRYLEGARQAADFLLKEHLRDDGSLWRTSSDGRVSGEGILDDYAFFADGLLELYQVSGKTGYLAASIQLVDYVLENFDRPKGAFFMSSVKVEAPLGRRVDYFDSVEPCGNSMMMSNLLKLAALTGETSYLDRVRLDLDRVSDLLDRAGPEMAWWFDTARKLIGPFYDVVIAGDDEKMVQAFWKKIPSHAVLSKVPAGGPDAKLAKMAPALTGKVTIDGAATAYVCRFGTCNAPTSSVAEMMRQIQAGWKH